METFTAIETRRSYKHFDPEHRLSEEEEKKILTAATLAPTAFNIQHWRFVVVKDPELRRAIREVAWDQAQVTDASLLVIMTGNLKAWEKNPARYWQKAPPEVAAFLVGAIGQYYAGREQVQRDEVMRSCGLAGQNIMLAARALGYDSCPMDGFDFDAVARLINLPADHVISFMIAIGKATQPVWDRPGQLALEEVVIRDRFS